MTSIKPHKTLPPASRSRLQGKQLLSANYAHGLACEQLVKQVLADRGMLVYDVPASLNRRDDIDCVVQLRDGTRCTVSIKSQHAGVAYKNVYFETEALQHRDFQTRELRPEPVWIPSWFYTGTAEVYVIHQNDKLRIYRKVDIGEYVAEHGWNHVRSLSPRLKATQGGSYPFLNARCGFLKWNQCTHQVIDVPDRLRGDFEPFVLGLVDEELNVLTEPST